MSSIYFVLQYMNAVFGIRLLVRSVLVVLLFIATAIADIFFALRAAEIANNLASLKDISLLSNVAAFGMLSSITHLLSNYAIPHFGSDLSSQIVSMSFREFLYRPYEILKSSSENEFLTKYTKYSESASVAVFNILSLVYSLVLSFVLSLFVFIEKPAIAFVALIGIGSTYIAASFVIGRRVAKLGKLMRDISHNLVSLVKESRENLTTIKLENALASTYEEFRDTFLHLRKTVGSSQFLSNLPKFLIELATLAFLVGFIGLNVNNPQTISTFLSSLILLAVVAQRLLPAVQNAFYSASIFLSHLPQLLEIASIHLDFHHENSNKIGSAVSSRTTSKLQHQFQPTKVKFISASFKECSYAYSSSSAKMHFPSLQFKSGSKIAIIGESGSGKTTYLELLMGLLPPKDGDVHISVKDIREVDIALNLNPSMENRDNICWRSLIAYVPQRKYFKTGTILQLVTGLRDGNHVNSKVFYDCLDLAEARSFVERLPLKEHTYIANKDSLLSGGQYQRLSIASALYSQKDILVLDEATSALDATNAVKVIRNIHTISNLTILHVTHQKIISELYSETLVMMPHHIQLPATEL